MGVQLFTDNAVSTVGTLLASGATSLSLPSGEGAKFPSPTGGDFAILTLTQSGTSETSWEDVTLTARSGDTLTITRSVAVAWAVGSKCELRVTSAFLNTRAKSGVNTDITSINGIYIGPGASGLPSNTVYGMSAFNNIYSASIKNVVIGVGAANYSSSIHTFAENVVIGHHAGYVLNNTTDAVLIGFEAGRDALQAHGNVAIGAYALTQTALSNIAIGYQASIAATGYGNTVMGYNAANANAGTELSTGTYNTIIGLAAGNVGTGSNNTVIGYNARASSSTVSNEITLGNSSIATLRCQVTSITSLSDVRDKKVIGELDFGLNFINALTPIEFIWNTRDGAKVGSRAAGFSAQDLLRVQSLFRAEALDLVSAENPEKLEARYGHLIPVLVKAIQDLSAQVEELKKKVG